MHGKDERVAEWILDKIADLDVAEARDILEEAGDLKTRVGRKALRLLRGKEVR